MFFSYILLINLVKASMVPVANSFLYCSGTDDLVLDCLPYALLVPLFAETLPRQHPELEKWDPQGVELEHSEDHGEI